MSKGINEIREIAKGLEKILEEISLLYAFNKQYIFDWQNVNHSL